MTQDMERTSNHPSTGSEIQWRLGLGFFLTEGLSYIEEYGHEIPSNHGYIRIVSMALDGDAAEWVMDLHDTDAPDCKISTCSWQFSVAV